MKRKAILLILILSIFTLSACSLRPVEETGAFDAVLLN